MRFFICAIACRLKLSLTGALPVAAVLFIIFLSFTIIAFSGRDKLMMNVGIFHTDTAYAQELESNFRRYSADTLIISRYTELEPMLKDVSRRRLECAYILPGQYSADVKIQMFLTPEAMGTGVSSLLLASTYMQSIAAEAGYKVLKNYLPLDKAQISAAIAENNSEYLAAGPFMNANYISATGHAPQSNSLFFAVSGTIALFSQLISLLFTLSMLRERSGAVNMRLKMLGGYTIPVADIAAIFLLNILFFAISGIVMSIFFNTHIPISISCAYAFFISALSVLLGRTLNSGGLFIGIIITSFLSTSIFSGIFFDIGGLIPELDSLKYAFAAYYFIEGLRGSSLYSLLVFAAIILTGVTLAVRD